MFCKTIFHLNFSKAANVPDSSQLAEVIFAIPHGDTGECLWKRYECRYCGEASLEYREAVEHVRLVSRKKNVLVVKREVK